MHSKKSKIDYSEYIKSDEWKFKSKAMRWIAGYRCQLCNSNNDTLDTHHRTYDNLGNETPSDLIVLCRDCHSKFHEKDRGSNQHKAEHKEVTRKELIDQIYSKYHTDGCLLYYTYGIASDINVYPDENEMDIFLGNKVYIVVEYDKYHETIKVGQQVGLVGTAIILGGDFPVRNISLHILELHTSHKDLSRYEYAPLHKIVEASTMRNHLKIRKTP